METLDTYVADLLDTISDPRPKKNAQLLFHKMSTQQSTQMWTLSEDGNEYERNKNLLNGRLKNSLSPDLINKQTMKEGLAHISVKAIAEVIHDGCDIRKKYSKALPNLAKVRDLDGDIINGYNSFNSVLISDLTKDLHLLCSTPYSTSDPHYNVLAGAGFTQDDIVLTQIEACDKALKAKFPNVRVRHLLDRGHDDQAVFDHIQGLNSAFVIRIKLNRNSDEFTTNDKNKKQFIKLQDAQLDHQYSHCLLKFVWKDKVYPQCRLELAQGKIIRSQKEYTVLRIQVYDRQKKSIFKEPMLLISNEIPLNFEECFALYEAYLRRSKIESVFKFLKTNLGWEDFRIRDFYSIQNIICLCFFIGGYFYENEQEMVKDPQVKFICTLAKSKGKISKHFYLEGLKIMANYILFQQAAKEQGLSQDQIKNLANALL